MLRRLLVNTAVSAFGFAATSVVSLVLVPILIAAYGLTEFGLITVARVLLPTGALAIFDFGYSEIATQTVASAQEQRTWSRAGGRLLGLAMIALAIGICVSVFMWLGAAEIVALLNTPAERAAAFGQVVALTALVFTPLLVAMVTEGVVKGFERFHALRTIEVLSAVLYGVSTCLLVYFDFGFEWIAFAYIGSLVVRALGIAVTAYILSRGTGVQLDSTTSQDWRDLSIRCRVMAWNKLLGTFQTQAAPLLIAWLLGPARVGIYDILVRLPRFAKTVLGNLNAAILPVAARLDASDDRAGMQRLGETGLIAVAVLAAPLTIGGAVFSQRLLELWVGPEFESLWQWQAAMFAVPLLNTLVSFGGTALLVRSRVVTVLNFIATLSLGLQFGLALLLVGFLDERAFILGQVIAVVAAFPFQLYIIAKEQNLSGRILQRLGKLVGLVTALGAVTMLAGVPPIPTSWLGLSIVLVVWLTLCYGAIVFIILTREERCLAAGMAGFWRRADSAIR